MYIMLSIEATVYADSNDKYSSILKFSKTRKLGLLSELKQSVMYLQAFGVWYQGPRSSTYDGIKVSRPVTDSSLQRSMCFPCQKVCIESGRSVGKENVFPGEIERSLVFTRSDSREAMLICGVCTKFAVQYFGITISIQSTRANNLELTKQFLLFGEFVLIQTSYFCTGNGVQTQLDSVNQEPVS